MDRVHVFSSAGRCRSEEQALRYVEVTFTDDGEAIPSAFMREIRLSAHEPSCIEIAWSPEPIPLRELLAEASFSEQWLPALDADEPADLAVCVFPPNEVGRPDAAVLVEHRGAPPYSA